MAQARASSGDVIHLLASDEELASVALVKTPELEVIRLTFPAGKEMPEHRGPGETTVQCLRGVVEVDAHGRTNELQAGDLIYLAEDEAHALRALEPSTVLLTMLLKPRAPN